MENTKQSSKSFGTLNREDSPLFSAAKNGILRLMIYAKRRRMLLLLKAFTYRNDEPEERSRRRRDGVNLLEFKQYVKSSLSKTKSKKDTNFYNDLEGLVDDCVFSQPRLISKSENIIKIAPDGWEMVEWTNATWVHALKLFINNHVVVKFFDWSIPVVAIYLLAHLLHVRISP